MPRLSDVHLLVFLILGASRWASAATLIDDDYSTFAPGNLADQRGYLQAGASGALPIQVANGQVVIAGGETTDNQDVYKNFAQSVTASDTETVSVFEALKLIVDSVPVSGSNSSYFTAFDATDASSFDNFRIAARAGTAPATFQLGTRVTGQSGAPYAFGEDLPLGAPFQFVLQAELVAGSGNDSAKLFILPTATDPQTVDYSVLTPYAVGTGGTDPLTLGSFIISQFGNATGVETAGVRISETVIFIPEPATGLALVVGATLLSFRRRATP